MEEATVPPVGRGRWKQEVGAGAATVLESLSTKQEVGDRDLFPRPVFAGRKDVEVGGRGSESRASYVGLKTRNGHSRTLRRDKLDVFTVTPL